MNGRLEPINKLLNVGEIEQAFEKSLSLIGKDSAYNKGLKALMIRYKVIDNKRRFGTLDQNDTFEANKIIQAFLELLETIENDFLQNNEWIKKQTKAFEKNVFPWLKEDFARYLQLQVPSFFKNLSSKEIIGIESLESKIDKNFWYIIHWRFHVVIESLTIYVVPKGSEDSQLDREIPDLKTNEWKKFVKEVFLAHVDEYQLPIFAIKCETIVKSSKYALEFQCTSAMYPDIEEIENYPWQKIL